MIDYSKDRELMEIKQQCESQVQELTDEFNEKMDEMKSEVDQLRERIVLEEKDSKYLRDQIQDKDS